MYLFLSQFHKIKSQTSSNTNQLEVELYVEICCRLHFESQTTGGHRYCPKSFLIYTKIYEWGDTGDFEGMQHFVKNRGNHETLPWEFVLDWCQIECMQRLVNNNIYTNEPCDSQGMKQILMHKMKWNEKWVEINQTMKYKPHIYQQKSN